MCIRDSPGALGTVPGEPQEPPQATPRALFGDPLASQRSPRVVLEASSLHFGAPGPHLPHFAYCFEPLFSLLFSLEFSLLRLVSLLVCPFYLVFSLLSSLFSLLSSLFSLRSSVSPAARTTSSSCFLSLTMFETSFQNSKLTVPIFSGAAGMRAALELVVISLQPSCCQEKQRKEARTLKSTE